MAASSALLPTALTLAAKPVLEWHLAQGTAGVLRFTVGAEHDLGRCHTLANHQGSCPEHEVPRLECIQRPNHDDAIVRDMDMTQVKPPLMGAKLGDARHLLVVESELEHVFTPPTPELSVTVAFLGGRAVLTSLPHSCLRHPKITAPPRWLPRQPLLMGHIGGQRIYAIPSIARGFNANETLR